MSDVDIRAGVVKAIKDALSINDDYLIQDDQLLCEDLGADSIDIREIGLNVEDAGGIEISDSDLYAVKTVRQLVDLAVRLHGEGRS